jgi:hypothetical protein
MFAPLSWAPGPAIPTPIDHGVAVVDGWGDIYVMGGKTAGGAGSKAVYARYGGAGTWATRGALDLPRVSAGAGQGSTGVIVFGGRASEVEDSALRYDPTGVDSQDAALMDTPRWQMGSAWDDSGVYAIGGLDDGGGVLKTVEIYDAAADAWSPVTAMPAARFALASVADGAGHLYAFGGASANNATSVSNSAYRYDEDSDTWSTLAVMPIAVRDAATAIGSDGKIYLIGGATAAGATASVQSYDPQSNAWSVEPSLPIAIRGAVAAPDAEGRIDVIGGLDANGQSLAGVWVTQRLNQPDVPPSFISTPVTRASADKPYSYQAKADGNPLPGFSLVQAPAGMTIDAATGVVSWQPTADQVGTQSVVIRATSFAGSVDQAFTVNVALETVPPSVPANLKVSGVGAHSISLAWDAATDNVGVAGYKIYERRRTGFKATRITYSLVGTSATNSFTVSNLNSYSTHAYAVSAIDTSGNESPRSAAVAATTLSLPSLTFFYGTPVGTALHPMAFSLYAGGNPRPTFSLVSGPEGMTVDPVSGLVKWVPGLTDIGSVPVTFRASNIVGSTDLSASITIKPDVPIVSATVSAALADMPMTVQLHDASLTPSSYSIVSAPAGMTIDAASGLATWTPTPEDAGTRSAVFAATNSAGTTNLNVSFYVSFTGAPANVQASNLTGTTALISWTPPADASHVAGYRITLSYRARAIRGYTTRTYTYLSNSTVTSFTATALTANVTYTPRVTPLDAAGNTGYSAYGASFVSSVVTPPAPTAPPAPLAPGDGVLAGGASDVPVGDLFSLVPISRPAPRRPVRR